MGTSHHVHRIACLGPGVLGGALVDSVQVYGLGCRKLVFKQKPEKEQHVKRSFKQSPGKGP